MADDQELDLVQISPEAKPPVCKVIDYKKFLYEYKYNILKLIKSNFQSDLIEVGTRVNK